MKLFNNKNGYGFMSILLHWLMALLVIGLYLLGIYMVDLDYYDAMYQTAPMIHKLVGVLTLFLLIIRLPLKYVQCKPDVLGSYTQWEVLLASIVHNLFYLLLVVMTISGYLISTLKGKGIDILGLFELPSLLILNEKAAEIVGKTHELSSDLFILLLFFHIIATIKHHVFDKDKAIIRILKPVE